MRYPPFEDLEIGDGGLGMEIGPSVNSLERNVSSSYILISFVVTHGTRYELKDDRSRTCTID